MLVVVDLDDLPTEVRLQRTRVVREVREYVVTHAATLPNPVKGQPWRPRISSAALRPLAPQMPAPGNVAAPVRYKPFTGVS